MKDGFKRFVIVVSLLMLSAISAYLVDMSIEKNDRKEYPLGDDVGVKDVISAYAEQYSIPEKVIYTVM